MLRTILLTGAASMFLASAAQAADFEEPPAVYDWSGAYIGAQVGYGWGSDNIDINNGDLEEDMDGIVAGGHIGFNVQSDALVFGLEGDLEWSDLEAESNPGGGNSAELNLDFIGSVRARLGYAMDNLLIYATGGVAIGSAEFEIQSGLGGSESDDFTNVGYTIGGGLEYGFSESLSGRIEYRYTDLGSEDINSDLFPGDDFEANLDFHAVRAGITWHFDAM